MAETPVIPINKIEGVTLEGNPTERNAVLNLLSLSLPLTSELVRRAEGAAGLSPIASAALAAINTASALMASAAPRCNLQAPPRDIEVKVDGRGNMIYRCQHNPPHEWDMTGKKLP